MRPWENHLKDPHWPRSDQCQEAGSPLPSFAVKSQAPHIVLAARTFGKRLCPGRMRTTRPTGQRHVWTASAARLHLVKRENRVLEGPLTAPQVRQPDGPQTTALSRGSLVCADEAGGSSRLIHVNSHVLTVWERGGGCSLSQGSGGRG